MDYFVEAILAKMRSLARSYSSWRCCKVFGEELLGVFGDGLVSVSFGR